MDTLKLKLGERMLLWPIFTWFYSPLLKISVILLFIISFFHFLVLPTLRTICRRIFTLELPLYCLDCSWHKHLPITHVAVIKTFHKTRYFHEQDFENFSSTLKFFFLSLYLRETTSGTKCSCRSKIREISISLRMHFLRGTADDSM